MIVYKTYYPGGIGKVEIEKLDLNKKTIIAELNLAAETDNGHEIGETQVSYFASKKQAERWARELLTM